MTNNYFITGLPKSGKTTILKELVKRLKSLGLKVGGILSSADEEHGTRERYIVTDLSTGESAVLAAVDGDGPKVSKYHLNLRAFEELITPTIRYARNYDVFVIDEIGPMEMRSTMFGDFLADLLSSEVPLVASLNEAYVDNYRGWGTIVELTSSNRGKTLAFLLDVVSSYKANKMTDVSESGQSPRHAVRNEKENKQRAPTNNKRRVERSAGKKKVKKAVLKKPARKPSKKRVIKKPKISRAKPTKVRRIKKTNKRKGIVKWLKRRIGF